MKRPPVIAFLLLAAALSLAGCATGAINWNEQIGVMTWREAVDELGPPDKSQKLEDGRMVAEWISSHADASPAMFVENDFRYQSASARLSQPARAKETSTLRLTFGTNNLLAAWSKN